MSESTHAAGEEPGPEPIERDDDEWLRGLALEALTQNANDINESALWFNKRIAGNRALRTKLYWFGVEAYLRNVRMSMRQFLARSGGTDEDTARRLAAGHRRSTERFSKAMAARTLYDSPLPVSGKPLGDATLQDLDQVIAYRVGRVHYEQREMEATQAIRDLLAASGKPTVREAISLDELRAIMAPEAAPA